jgi:DNA-binding CsgD family transcriptional regulator/tetratricopeptide (TPR) repeat protein
VGRDRELRRALEHLVGAESAAVLVTGPEGCGRTRLAREIVAAAGERGARTVWVSATAAAAAIPFGAFAHLLPEPAVVTADDPLGRMMALASVVAAEDAHSQVVLAIDDAHDLDPGGAALLDHLLRTRSASVVATIRSGAGAEPARALWKDVPALRIDLALLDEQTTGSIAEAILDGPLDGRTRRRLHRLASGRVGALLRLLADELERGTLLAVSGVWTLADASAAGPRVAEVALAAVETMAEADRSALEHLALAGALPAPVFAEVAGPERARSLERRGLVVAERRAQRLELVVAPTLAGVLRAGIPSGIATTALRRMADAVEGLGRGDGDDLVRVASWRLQADGRGDAPLLTAAARLAGGTRSPQLAEPLGRAALAAGAGLGAAAALAAVLVRQNRHAEAASLLSRYEGELPGAASDEAREFVLWRARALQAAVDAGSSHAVRFLRRAGVSRCDPGWPAHVRAVRADLLGRAGRHEETVAVGLSVLRDASAEPPAATLCARAVALALTFSGRTQTALAYLAGRAGSWPRLVALIVRGELDDAETMAEPAYRQALEDDDEKATAEAMLALGWTALARGRPRTAQRRLVEAAIVLRRLDGDALLGPCLLLLTRAEALLGRLDAARAARDEAAAHIAGPLHRALADVAIAAAEGQLETARGLTMEAAEDCAAGPLARFVLLHRALLLGGAASELAPALRTLRPRLDVPWVEPVVAHAEAAAADDPHALEAAAAAFEEHGLLLHAAVALQTAIGCGRGVGAWQLRVRRLLDRCEGARPAVAEVGDPRAGLLTPREQEIARLAATGLTSAEIARRLVVSVRTVESHLYRAYAKLGVDRREELAAVLGRPPAAAARAAVA